MNTCILDPNTNKPFENLETLSLWLDLDYFIKTGKHRQRVKLQKLKKANGREQ